jgi:chromosome partitioning protein
MAIKVSIINFKGGVGKTTLAFHLAAFLAGPVEKPKRVLMVDLDHQSSLSIIVLRSAIWEDRLKRGRTSNRIFEAFCNRKVKTPGAEIITKNPFHERDPRYNFYPKLDLLPAQFELDDTEIELASTTIGGATSSEWAKRTLMAEWLDQIEAESKYDYVIFDCPPATKLVSQNAIASSDYFVVPVIPDDLSTRGLEHFLGLVTNKINGKLEYLRAAAPIAEGDVPKNYVKTTKLAAIVPYMAKSAGRAASGLTNLHTRHIQTLNADWDEAVVSPVKHMTGIPESLADGWPAWKHWGTQNISPAVQRMMTRACEQVSARLV